MFSSLLHIGHVAAGMFVAATLFSISPETLADEPSDVGSHSEPRTPHPKRASNNVDLGLRVPEGFEVMQFSDHTLANDIYSMTLDPQGRVVVSGRGYVRILVDDDDDGRADRALPFADGPADGAMGMLWEGSSLYVTGDGGLRRYRDRDGDDRADGPSEMIRAIKTGGEHDAHAIRRGPDGWLYLICGNFTGVDSGFAELPTSPIREPVAGCVLRFTPDLEHSEIVADGFRNAYDMDFNLDGELFAYDSDNERCVSLPWYEPTRFYHVIPGRHYGWRAPQRASFWRFPPYYFDVVEPLAYLNRGSPTGVECYRHTAFPAKYHGGMFALDWTFGRIYFLPLERTGATYTAEPEVFAEAVGDNGFAPTDVVVHPATGDLYVSVGGRGTRGAVYRIHYRGDEGDQDGGWHALEGRDVTQPHALRDAQGVPPAGVRAAWVDCASVDDALARLRALNLIARHRQHFDDEAVTHVIRANWGSPDRYVRYATAKLIASLPDIARRAIKTDTMTPPQLLTYGWGLHQDEPQGAVEEIIHLIADKECDADLRLEAVRLVEVALGDIGCKRYEGTVWEGYSRRGENDEQAADVSAIVALAAPALRIAFPSGDAELDRELSRTLALIEDDAPATLDRVAAELTESSDPIDDIHYLIVLSRLRAARTPDVTSTVAGALVALDRKILDRGLHRDLHWPLRIAELHQELVEGDPDLNAAILACEEFGRPGHVLFAQQSNFDRRRAAEVFFKRASEDDEYAWSPELVRLIGSLSDTESLKLIRSRWGEIWLRDAILDVLSRRPLIEDRERFVAGLALQQLDTVVRCVAALSELPPLNEPADVLEVVKALRRLRGESRQEEQLRQSLSAYLERVAGTTRRVPRLACPTVPARPHKHCRTSRQWHPGGSTLPSADTWSAWFAETYPELTRQLEAGAGVNLAAWRQRLARVDWEAGDAGRGAAVFQKASCAACHSSARALGPDLKGVATRFSRDDLFTAILEPNRDVPPRYQSVQIVTHSGRSYQGAIIYEAVDGVILQTGPTETLRLGGDEIESMASVPTSLMPTGLLDSLSDAELADLFAYLKRLRQ